MAKKRTQGAIQGVLFCYQQNNQGGMNYVGSYGEESK